MALFDKFGLRMRKLKVSLDLEGNKKSTIVKNADLIT